MIQEDIFLAQKQTEINEMELGRVFVVKFSS